MAKKRMFSLGVLETDAFLDMPLSAQALYFHLCLRADDDGFVGNPKRITQTIGASIDDLKLLVVKRFILAFEDGVIVIKHWRMHNAIKADRYQKTNFTEDFALLQIKDNGAYTMDNVPMLESNGAQMERKWSANGAQMAQTCSVDKIREDKRSIDKNRLDKDVSTELNSVLALPLNDGTEFFITESMVKEWKELYPAVDVMQQLRSMKGWLIANPSRKKTKRGIARFINTWLSKEQDKGRPSAQKANPFMDALKEMEDE